MSLPLREPEIDWARYIRQGDRVVCSQMTGEPRALLGGLAAALAAGRVVKPRSVFVGTPFSPEAGELPGDVIVEVLGGMGSAAAIGTKRDLAIYPVHYSQVPNLFARDGLASDVVLVGLARHPGTGRLYMAPSHGYVIEAARRARRVVAQVNAEAPCVRGAEWPEDIVPDVCVEVAHPLAVAAGARAGAIEAEIGRNVASCVRDGSTVQIGIGAVANAVAGALRLLRGLRVHSGLFTDELHELVRCGAVDPGTDDIPAVTCSAVYGSAQLYREVHDDPRYRIAPPSVTHGLFALAALPRFTAINSALEVDLLGQVNVERVGGRYLGGVGGLNDFVRGAMACPEGRSIVAVPSRRRSRHGETASFVPTLSGPATVPASDADIFVSEHGVASLRGASRSERARAIIGIAHPEDREALARAARDLGVA